MADPSRGQVWTVDFNPTRGHEQSGARPALVTSADPFNQGPAGLVIVVPITSKNKGIPFHVAIDPPEGGLNRRSYIKCEDIRSVAKERLSQFRGNVSSNTLAQVGDRLRVLLDL